MLIVCVGAFLLWQSEESRYNGASNLVLENLSYQFALRKDGRIEFSLIKIMKDLLVTKCVYFYLRFLDDECEYYTI